MRPDDVCGWVRKPSRSSWVMSLRTVALDTPRSREVVTVWDATGWAVRTYSSTTAFRTVARRSVASIASIASLPVARAGIALTEARPAPSSSRVYRLLAGATDPSHRRPGR